VFDVVDPRVDKTKQTNKLQLFVHIIHRNFHSAANARDWNTSIEFIISFSIAYVCYYYVFYVVKYRMYWSSAV